jgi:hypothetical protein
MFQKEWAITAFTGTGQIKLKFRKQDSRGSDDVVVGRTR